MSDFTPVPAPDSPEQARGPWGSRPVERVIAEDDRRAPDANLQTPCDACGAVLTYAPGTESLKCEWCGNVTLVEAPEVEIVEHDLEAALGAGTGAVPDEEAVRTAKCGGCGASFTFDPAVHAGRCPFCDRAVVGEPVLVRQIRPMALVPFAIDAKTAQVRLKSWLGSLWFAPNKLQAYARREGDLNGVYLPYWTFDSLTVTDYSGLRGDVYHVPQQVTQNVNGRRVTRTVMVQKVRWRPASGRVRRRFDDVTVPASPTLPCALMDGLEPWELGALKPFTGAYIAGFQAETYRTGLDEGFKLAERRMQARIAADVRLDIGGDVQRINRMDIRHFERSFKHVLLPLWIGAFRFRGKVYRVCVSGQSGRVAGERPWSVWKLAFAALLLALLLALAWWAGGAA